MSNKKPTAELDVTPKRAVRKKRKHLRDEDDDVRNALVTVGFTPNQVQAIFDVAGGDAPPAEMVRVGFWPCVADKFVNFETVTADDLTRAGFSQAQVSVLIEP